MHNFVWFIEKFVSLRFVAVVVVVLLKSLIATSEWKKQFGFKSCERNKKRKIGDTISSTRQHNIATRNIISSQFYRSENCRSVRGAKPSRFAVPETQDYCQTWAHPENFIRFTVYFIFVKSILTKKPNTLHELKANLMILNARTLTCI